MIRNGILQQEPVLDETVANDDKRGMLGITSDGSKIYVYFTAVDVDSGKAIENRIYKYDWNGKEKIQYSKRQ